MLTITNILFGTIPKSLLRESYKSNSIYVIKDYDSNRKFKFVGCVEACERESDDFDIFLIDGVCKAEVINKEISEMYINSFKRSRNMIKLHGLFSFAAASIGMVIYLNSYNPAVIIPSYIAMGYGFVEFLSSFYTFRQFSKEINKWESDSLNDFVKIRQSIPYNNSLYILENKLKNKYVAPEEATYIWRKDIQKIIKKFSSDKDITTSEKANIVINTIKKNFLTKECVNEFEEIERIGETANLVNEMNQVISDYNKLTEEYEIEKNNIRSKYSSSETEVERNYNKIGTAVNAVYLTDKICQEDDEKLSPREKKNKKIQESLKDVIYSSWKIALNNAKNFNKYEITENKLIELSKLEGNYTESVSKLYKRIHAIYSSYENCNKVFYF
jgi:hypothetical protein